MKQYTTKTASLRTTIGQIKKVYADTVYINDTSEGSKNCGAPTNIIDVVTSWGITFPNNDSVSFTIPSATAEVDGVVYIASDINDERSNAVVSATLLKNTLNQFYYNNFGYVDNGSSGGIENDLSGFTALAYLESDGGSWIDTEMALSQNHSVYLKARYNSLTSSYSTDGGFAYGYRSSYGSSDGHCFILNGVPSAYFTYGTPQNSNIGNVWEGNDLTICNTQQSGYIKYTDSNGVEQTITIRSAYSGNGFTTSGTAYLFALNTPNGDVRRINGRIYEYKVVDETTGEIVQHLLPYLDRDGVPCMYDVVQKKAHYNIGEKQFTYGQGVYEFFEYVQNQSDRIDENIDLELTLGVDITPFELTMEYEVYHISGNVNFVGNWRSGTNQWLVCNKANFEVLVPYSSVSVTRKATPVNLTIKHTPTYVTCNGTTYNITPANTSDVLPLKVLGSSSANPGVKQYKWVKIYNDGKLIRDLVPAKRLSDNWVGMYCKLDNKFYGGTNADSFLVSYVPYGYRECEYIQSTGTQWIDTEVEAQINVKLWCKIQFPNGYNDDYFASLRVDDNDTRYYLLNMNGGKGLACTKYVWCYACSMNSSDGVSSPVEIESYIGDNQCYIKVNDDVYSNNEVLSGVPTNKTIPLFGGKINNSDTVNKNSPKSTLYYAKLYVGDAIVRDLIPCLDASSVPCMYDRISGKTFYNKGTGTFSYKLKGT